MDSNKVKQELTDVFVQCLLARIFLWIKYKENNYGKIKKLMN